MSFSRTSAMALGAMVLIASACERPTDPGDGLLRTLWFLPEQGYAESRPVVSGDVVYMPTGDARIVARDRTTGAVRWSSYLSAGGAQRAEGAELIAKGGVVVASAVFHTTGFDAATGRVLWTYLAPPDTLARADSPAGQLVFTSMDATDSTVFVPAWGASISAVDLRTGAVRWVWRPGRTPTDTAASLFRSGGHGVRVSGDTVFATVWHFLNATGTRSEAWVLALDGRTGREFWRATLPTLEYALSAAGRPAIAGDLVIALTRSGHLFALARASGAVRWHVTPDVPPPGFPFNTVLAGPEVRDGTVYFDGGVTALRAVRAATGAHLWRSSYPGQFGSDLLVTDTHIYGVDGGSLHLFDRATGRRLAKLRQPGETTGSVFGGSPGGVDGQVFLSANNRAWSFAEP